MPIQIKSTEAIAAKFAKRAQAAGADYSDGVKSPRRDQAAAAEAAAPNWAAAVTEAAGRNAFAKGVAAAGTEKWQRKASTIGAQRYPQGVAAAQPDYAKGVAPFLDVLRNVTLPPRGLKGTNVNRVQIVVDALRKAKLGA